jgi:hypothetical protein
VRRKTAGRVSEKHYIYEGGNRISSGLKVHRQCLLALLVEVLFRGGNALGSEIGRGYM